MRIKVLFLLIIALAFLNPIMGQDSKENTEKLKVLNFATFHLSNSTDANTSPVDINNPEVQKNVDKIVEKLMEFKPTIICIEVPAKVSGGTNEIYQQYKKNQSKKTNWSEEINSIAFEVGRLAGVENIYGIDYQLGFNYPKLMELAKDSDNPDDVKFMEENARSLEKFNELSLLGKFKIMNTEAWRAKTLNFYNFLATMHTEGRLEGPEIISEFYKRNLAIYSNFSDIPKNSDDRVLIIMGGTHSAFLDLFLKNNPDIELVNPAEYVAE